MEVDMKKKAEGATVKAEADGMDWDDPFVRWITGGGFVYFDFKYDIVAINALCSTQVMTLLLWSSAVRPRAHCKRAGGPELAAVRLRVPQTCEAAAQNAVRTSRACGGGS